MIRAEVITCPRCDGQIRIYRSTRCDLCHGEYIVTRYTVSFPNAELVVYDPDEAAASLETWEQTPGQVSTVFIAKPA